MEKVFALTVKRDGCAHYEKALDSTKASGNKNSEEKHTPRPHLTDEGPEKPLGLGDWSAIQAWIALSIGFSPTVINSSCRQRHMLSLWRSGHGR
jgi:hypothetical protein